MRRILALTMVAVVLFGAQAVHSAEFNGLDRLMARLEQDLPDLKADVIDNGEIWGIEDPDLLEDVQWDSPYPIRIITVGKLTADSDGVEDLTLDVLVDQSQPETFFCTLHARLATVRRQPLAHAVYIATGADLVDQLEFVQSGSFASTFIAAESAFFNQASRLGCFMQVDLYRFGIQYFLATTIDGTQWVLPIPLGEVDPVGWTPELWTAEEVIWVFRQAVQDSAVSGSLNLSFKARPKLPGYYMSKVWSVWIVLPLALLLFVAAVLIVRRKLLEEF